MFNYVGLSYQRLVVSHLSRVFNHLEDLKRKVEKIKCETRSTHLSANSSVKGESNIEADVLENCFDSSDPVGRNFQLISHGAEHRIPNLWEANFLEIPDFM